jgi:hypothetical protein
LALIDGAGAIPGLGKTVKLAKLFGGFIARSVRKAGRAAGHKPRGHAMSSAGDGYRGRDGKLRPQDRAPESAGAPGDPEPSRQPEKGPVGASRTTRTGDREIDSLLDKSDQDLVEMFEERVRPFRDRSLGTQKSRSTTKGHAHSLEELSKLLPPGATLEEKKHLFDLALDTNKTLRPNELEQAQRYFGNDISKVRRSSDPKVDYELEVADPKSGRKLLQKIDFVGGVSDEQGLVYLEDALEVHVKGKPPGTVVVLDKTKLSETNIGRRILDKARRLQIEYPGRLEIL